MRSPHRLRWIAPAVTVAVTLAAYFNSLDAPFVFDDASSVTNNPSIRRLSDLGFVLAPPSECTVAGRPFANLTFALNYAWNGLSVRGYHVFNLAIHACSALLLLGIVRRSLLFVPHGNPARGDFRPFLPQRVELIGLMVAAIWAAHPLLTSAVTYVSQRTEVLMGLCYLATLYTFIRGTQATARSWFVVSVAFCLLGVASKEGMVTAPVLILLYDRTFLTNSFREIWKVRRNYYLSLAASWLLLGFLLAGLKDRAVGFGLGVSWWTYALTECRAIVLYLKLVFWPFPLVFDYGADFLRTYRDSWPYLVAIAGGSAAAVGMLLQRPRAGFLAVAFFLLLAPTSSVVPISTQPMSENRVYLPSAAVIALAVVGVHRCLGAKFIAPAVFVVGGVLCLSLDRNRVLSDRLALWSDTVAKRPGNARAQATLGEVFFSSRDLQRARVQFETALAMDPNYHEAHNNLGTTLFELGDPVGARRHFEAALRLRPDFAAAHNNLGNVLLRLGEIEKAAWHCEEAIRLYSQPNRLTPDLAETHNNLGNIRLSQGNPGLARDQYEAAVRLKPQFLAARMNLGVAQRLLGQLEPARKELQYVVDLQPASPEAQFNLGVVLEQLGRRAEAIECFETAVRLKPDFQEARRNLGQLLWQRGDAELAKIQLEAAIRLRPDDAGARASLEEILGRAPGKPPSGGVPGRGK